MPSKYTVGIVAISILAFVSTISVVVLAILFPENPGLIERILTITIPTIAALAAVLRSTENSRELLKLNNKADVTIHKAEELKEEAVQAKEAASTVNTVVVEQIAPQVEQVAAAVQELTASSGNGSGSGHTPPHVNKQP